MRYLTSDTPPPLSERDTKVRDDDEWRDAAKHYIAAKGRSEQSAAALEEAKAALVALTSHPSESGGGVSVTQYWKRGQIAYSKIAALKGLDLEAFRGPSRMETRVAAS